MQFIAARNMPDRPPNIRTLFSADAISARVAALGAQLAQSHADKAPLMLGTLTGAFAFTADLARAMSPHPRGMHVDFVRAASYAGAMSTGVVRMGGMGGGGATPPPHALAHHTLGTKVPVNGRHVLLVEDIVDTGRTLAALALPARFSVTVLAVAGDGGQLSAPDPTRPLAAHERRVVAGAPGDLQRVRSERV